MSRDKGVMVYCPAQNGVIEPGGLELLCKGRRLANQLNELLYAAVIGCGVRNVTAHVAEFGADTIYVVDREELSGYTAQAFCDAIELVIEQAAPSIVLVSATLRGRDFAARLATRLHTGLTADCTALEIDPETGLLLQIRPAYGGNVLATVICKERRPQMATVRPDVFQISKPGRANMHTETIDLSGQIVFSRTGVILLRRDWLQPETNMLQSAGVVVACGLGVKNKKGVALAEELAKALGAVIAGSRAAVENGLLPRCCQVGQTGKTIRPRLYIACGISGSVQHLVGMQQAECVIAINSDLNAPIFQAADYGICADLFEVLPKLTAMLIQ